jgi:hypothetical protein
VVVQFVPVCVPLQLAEGVVIYTLCKRDAKERICRSLDKRERLWTCRLYPSEKNCSLTISGTEEEVLTVAVRHAVQGHGHENSPKRRQELKALLKDE